MSVWILALAEYRNWSWWGNSRQGYHPLLIVVLWFPISDQEKPCTTSVMFKMEVNCLDWIVMGDQQSLMNSHSQEYPHYQVGQDRWKWAVRRIPILFYTLNIWWIISPLIPGRSISRVLFFTCRSLFHIKTLTHTIMKKTTNSENWNTSTDQSITRHYLIYLVHTVVVEMIKSKSQKFWKDIRLNRYEGWFWTKTLVEIYSLKINNTNTVLIIKIYWIRKEQYITPEEFRTKITFFFIFVKGRVMDIQ